MPDVLREAGRRRAAGGQVAVAAVVATRRPAPSPPGANLAARDEGLPCGCEIDVFLERFD